VHGEAHFRRLEAELTGQVEDRKAVVLAPGGGWVTQQDLVERLRPSSLFVWLRVRPDTVYDRHSQGGLADRPLLDVDEPRATIRELLAAREPLYGLADIAIDTDTRSAEGVAEQIVELLRSEEVGGRG
ncbi:MAG: shikimate kinase, partial [Gemmatimonadales bacterium]|jgi:shikimate kinase